MLKIFRMSFYAVAKGRKIGIFRSWSECESQVKEFKGAKFKKFRNIDEAQKFMQGTKFNFDGNSKPKKQKLLHFAEKIDKLQKGEKEKVNDCDQEDEEFMNLPEYSDNEPSTSSAQKLKRKAAPDIKFESPESTTEKLYNGFNFEEDIKGFVHVYTDGSCREVGKPTAAAGLGVYFGKDHKLNVSEPVTGKPTNSVGEIQAAIRAIEIAQKYGIKRLCIFTDSQFLINSVCIWMSSWKKKNWKLSKGSAVVNQKDFKRLDELIESGNMLIKWSYIPAHNGYHGNEEADRLAKLGADKYRKLSALEKEENSFG